MADSINSTLLDWQADKRPTSATGRQPSIPANLQLPRRFTTVPLLLTDRGAIGRLGLAAFRVKCVPRIARARRMFTHPLFAPWGYPTITYIVHLMDDVEREYDADKRLADFQIKILQLEQESQRALISARYVRIRYTRHCAYNLRFYLQNAERRVKSKAARPDSGDGKEHLDTLMQHPTTVYISAQKRQPPAFYGTCRSR